MVKRCGLGVGLGVDDRLDVLALANLLASTSCSASTTKHEEHEDTKKKFRRSAEKFYRGDNPFSGNRKQTKTNRDGKNTVVSINQTSASEIFNSGFELMVASRY